MGHHEKGLVSFHFIIFRPGSVVIRGKGDCSDPSAIEVDHVVHPSWGVGLHRDCMRRPVYMGSRGRVFPGRLEFFDFCGGGGDGGGGDGGVDGWRCYHSVITIRFL